GIERLVSSGERGGGLALPAGHHVTVEARELRLLPANLGDGVFHLLSRRGHRCPVNGRLGCHSRTSLSRNLRAKLSSPRARFLLLLPRSRPARRAAGQRPGGIHAVSIQAAIPVSTGTHNHDWRPICPASARPARHGPRYLTDLRGALRRVRAPAPAFM